MESIQLENKDVFQDIIRDYEAARPGYPPELYRDIIAFSKLGNGAKVLEIGSGPGQATAYFVENGYHTTALEISEKQVAFLQEKFAEKRNLQCVCSTFESFESPNDSFDLIFSATAFHWIKPEVGYPKAHRLLKPNGVMAVFWHLASIIEPETEMLCEIREIYRTHAPELDDYITREEGETMHLRLISEMQTGGLFQNLVSRTYRWDDVYETERYLKLMNSYSDFHAISKDAREAILSEVAAYIECNGGRITIPQEVRLYMARK